MMNFIWISSGAIPTFRHNLEVGFVWKGCYMEFPVMGIKKSAGGNTLDKGKILKFCFQIEEFIVSFLQAFL